MVRQRIGHAGNLHPRLISRKQLTAFFAKKNTGSNLLFCFATYSVMTGLKSKMWCVMLTRIGLFILQQFLHIGCLRIVIAYGPTHSLKGEIAGPEVTIHIQNYRLFWRILLKHNLAIGKAYMDGSLTITNEDLEQLLARLGRLKNF